MPIINFALNFFGMLVILIIFVSCLSERLKKENASNTFLLMMTMIVCALCFDMIAWSAEGHLNLSDFSVFANTIAFCAGHAAILFFLLYVRQNLLPHQKTAIYAMRAFIFLCIACIIVIAVNAHLGLSYRIDLHGHYRYARTPLAILSHFLFPALSLFATFFMLVAAKGTPLKTRAFYLLYILFPMIGVLLDFTIHGLSVTYIGMVLSTLIIYTNIYLQKRSIIAEQKNALLMSQINPHFTYNTLTAIASLCDLDPKQAKSLTIEFSSFLRKNLETLSTTELISFEQELRHVDCYLKIEHARFGDKLKTEYHIECENFSLPPLSVQPLVENAVRHGVTKKAGGGTICITAYQTERTYVVEIKDDGVGFDPSEKKNDAALHVGLSNVRSRLKNMCGGTLHIQSVKGVGTCIRMEIPRKKTKRKEK